MANLQNCLVLVVVRMLVLVVVVPMTRHWVSQHGHMDLAAVGHLQPI
jgi:hypothetical protein